MTRLLLIRHAPTAWNEAKRIQGRTDEPLSDAGCAQAARWRLPPCFRNFSWMTSPLTRCRQTARLMGALEAEADDRLIEMAWGEWEGRTLEALRRELGTAMTENEARGLDFTPPGGESPRMVQNRLLPLLAETAGRARPRVAVTHRGVIRSTLALATGWDMKGKPPARIDAFGSHLFHLSARGVPRVERLNIPLLDSSPAEAP